MTATNIRDLLSQRQLTLEEWQERRLYRHIHGHSSLVERLGYIGQLEGHHGCVNCLEWNPTGSLLASGSDDLSVIVWAPNQRRSVAVMPTGHTGNIFSVKFVPFSGDNLLLTGAEDREVRLHDLTSFETTQIWSCSQNRVKRIATSPHLPHLFWSAAEDGCVRQIDTREPHSCQGDGTCRNVLIDLKPNCGPSTGSTQCKCVDINPVRQEQIAVGALDAFVRLYDTRVLSLKSTSRDLCSHGDPSCLAHFSPGHISNPRTKKARRAFNTLATTFVAFSPDGEELLVNLSGEHIYLYDTTHFREASRYSFDKTDPSSVPRLQSRSNAHIPPSSHGTRESVRRRLTMPFCHSHQSTVVSAASTDQSRISHQVIRLKEEGDRLYREEKLSSAIQRYSSAVLLCPTWHILYCSRAQVLNSRKWEGDAYAALRDAETALTLCPTHKAALQHRLRCLQHLGWYEEAKRFLSVYQEAFPQDKEFHSMLQSEVEKMAAETASKNGFRTERRHLSQWEATRQQNAFDYKLRFAGHCNTHTDIKEANFIGQHGEYIAAGSDDGNIFIWEKATGNLVHVLHGDDSIVNCIQWNPTSPLLATSGIESAVRLWEPKCLRDKDDPRVVRDVHRVSRENQQRMKVDPFEIMLMRMGFHVAMANEGSSDNADVRRRGGGEDSDEDAPIWVEDPTSCRQS